MLSFDSMVDATGGVAFQPIILALPFLMLARRENAPADAITDDPATATASARP